MTRLTRRDRASGAVLLTPAAKRQFRDDPKNFLLGKLAQYEDTGLDPEEVQALKLYAMGKATGAITEFDGISMERLRQLADLDKRGLLLVRDEDISMAMCAGAAAIRSIPLSGSALFEFGDEDQRTISFLDAARILEITGQGALRCDA